LLSGFIQKGNIARPCQFLNKKKTTNPKFTITIRLYNYFPKILLHIFKIDSFLKGKSRKVYIKSKVIKLDHLTSYYNIFNNNQKKTFFLLFGEEVLLIFNNLFMERICVLCNTSKTCFGGWHRFEQKEDGTFHSGTIDWIISSPIIPSEKTKDRMYLCNACWSPNFHAFRKIKPGGKKKGPKHKRSEDDEDEDEKVKRAKIDHELKIMREEEEKLKKNKRN